MSPPNAETGDVVSSCPQSSSPVLMSEVSAEATQVPLSFSDNPSAERGEQTLSEPSSFTLASVSKKVLGYLLRRRNSQPESSVEHSEARQNDPVGKYLPGYGRRAASMNMDSAFSLFRKFGWVRTLVLLHLQDELQELEKRLKQYEMGDHASGDQRRRSCQIDAAPDDPRKMLIYEISGKLKEYDECLLRAHNVQAMKPPLSRDQDSVKNIIEENMALESPNAEDLETSWIRQNRDLVSVAEPRWLDGFVEDIIGKVSRPLLRKGFRSKDSKQTTETIEQLDLVSAQRIDALITIVITLVAALGLLVPLLVLYKLQQPSIPVEMVRTGYFQIFAIFIATLLFSATLSFLTTMQRKDVFTAMAAYCAVWVVFLGNTNNSLGFSNGGVEQSPN